MEEQEYQEYEAKLKQDEVEQYQDQKYAEHIDFVNSLPDGFKVYECTDCGTINVKKDNGEIRVGFCDECGHPLWN